MSQTITKGQLIDAYSDFTCQKWRTHIFDLLNMHPLAKDSDKIEIPNEILSLLNEEGTKVMKDYALRIGLSFNANKNPFIKVFNTEYLQKVSKELFSDGDALQIAKGGAEGIFRKDLVGKALYISSDYEVKMFETPMKGTVIEIIKK